jgi:L-serine/L-threonine ammonia-lyase
MEQLEQVELGDNGHAIKDTSKLTPIYPDAIVCAVGGGGLLNGLVQGLQEHQTTGIDMLGLSVPIVAVETHGANCFHASVMALNEKANALIQLNSNGNGGNSSSSVDLMSFVSSASKVVDPVTLSGITSVATSLGAKTVSKKSLDNFAQYPIIPFCVSDEMSLNACYRLLQDHRLLVEPACGAGLSILYNNLLPDFLFGNKAPEVSPSLCLLFYSVFYSRIKSFAI